MLGGGLLWMMALAWAIWPFCSLCAARGVVIALEPYPRLYGEALLDIKANGLADRVVLS
jgi:hypothetical protein